MATLRTGLILILVLGMLAGVVWWTLRGGRGVRTPVRTVQPAPGSLEMSLHKVRIYGVSGGKVVWEVEAESFDLSRDRPLQRVTGLKRATILNDGKQELQLSAQRFERNTYTGEIIMSGDVAITGKAIDIRTPQVTWDPLSESLRLPDRFSAKFGDIALEVDGQSSFDVKGSILRADGRIVVTTQGNTLRTGSVLVDIPNQHLTLDKTVTMHLHVAEMQAWAQGEELPSIPPIPDGVRARYQEYCRKQGLTPPPLPGTTPGR